MNEPSKRAGDQHKGHKGYGGGGFGQGPAASPEHVVSLVTKAQGGDEKAFSELYETFVSPIYRYIFFNVRNKDEAEDLTQTVFLKAFKALPDYVARGVPFGAWLYAIARNATIDYWKKRRDVVVDNPDELFGEIKDTKEDAEASTSRERRASYIRDLLGELSLDQREVVTLFFVEELSHTEIAQITGKTEEAIRALKHRAIKALREKVDERYL